MGLPSRSNVRLQRVFEDSEKIWLGGLASLSYVGNVNLWPRFPSDRFLHALRDTPTTLTARPLFDFAFDLPDSHSYLLDGSLRPDASLFGVLPFRHNAEGRFCPM
jgi:hypothetical protein